MKILVTGITGQLGYEIVSMIEKDEVIGVGRKDMDITDLDKTRDFIKGIKPDVLIHCGAFTKVDDAEANMDSCYKVNVVGTQCLASACYECGAKMVYVSTDYVFDGKKQSPYTEFDSANPLNIYGKSKLDGENILKEILPRHFIVRTAWLYGVNGNNFVKIMLKLSKEKDIVKVVDDQRGTPTSTVDLARCILRLIKTDNYGTYHGTCKGDTTWFDFTRMIYCLADVKTRVLPITSEELARRAVRPKYSVLRNYMCELTIGDPFRDWEECLREYINKVPI